MDPRKVPRPPDLNGVLLVDKPKGPTSFDVVRVVKRLSQTKSAGHTGTLDPAATGLLAVCLGDATRIVQFLQIGEKEYEGVVRFGVTTDTQDAEGKVLEERDATGLDEPAVRAAVEGLVGVQDQVPPMYSALKKDGRPLYELAREGVEVDREAREIVVSEARLVAWAPPEATFVVRCSKGTYVRTLAVALGEKLGCGAHLCGLRRRSSGGLDVREAASLDVLDREAQETGRAGIAARLLTVEQALSHLPEIKLDSRTAVSVSFGNAVEASTLATLGVTLPQAGAHVRLVDAEGLVVAVGEVADGRVKLLRVLRPRSGPGKQEPRE